MFGWVAQVQHLVIHHILDGEPWYLGPVQTTADHDCVV